MLKQRKKCSIENCQRLVYCKNYCIPHYRRLKLYGNPNGGFYDINTKKTINKKKKKKCDIDGCESFVIAKGFCRLHYKRNR